MVGGTLFTHGGGYPIQSWGVHHPIMVRGYPGYPPIQTWPGGTPGTPYSRPVWGYPTHSWWGYPIQSWWGYLGTPHHPDLAREYPGYFHTIKTWPGSTPGIPHHPDLAGVPPTIKTFPGTPPPSRPSWGIPPHHQDLAGVPPPS